MKIDVKGVLVPNDYKDFYDWMGQECTCPAEVSALLGETAPDEPVEVYINSPGGVIDVGSEIYTALRNVADRTKIYVTGQACSAASVVAMAAYCEMAPTALMMVHCVSTSASGNHNDMEKAAEMLATADKAMCRAYMDKTGMSEADALAMMERETWLTAPQAVGKGLVNGIMFTDDQGQPLTACGESFTLPTAEQLEKARAAMAQQKAPAAMQPIDNSAAVMAQRNKIKRLKMRG